MLNMNDNRANRKSLLPARLLLTLIGNTTVGGPGRDVLNYRDIICAIRLLMVQSFGTPWPSRWSVALLTDDGVQVKPPRLKLMDFGILL